MAHNTSETLQGLVLYSVFVRNHSAEGTFAALAKDLDRIKALGVDAIWLMPIHPVGELARKGSMGSPYANRDYRSIDPAYGSMDDFCALVDAIHDRSMKCLIDVVYNHTSPDSVLWKTHPEFFWRTAEGKPGNHVGDWSDIIDLDYSVPELWDYQIESLEMWAQIVDGFRCDVASFVPVEFWKQVRERIGRVKPNFIWLAETVHRHFGAHMRAQGLYCATDLEAYDAFDIEYAYDVQTAFDDYLAGKTTLAHYLDLLEFEESVYPRNYNKLRFLENHDTERIASQLHSIADLQNFTALLFFEKGATLLYAGQEFAVAHRPSLFERDPINWDTGHDISAYIARLSELKHQHWATCNNFRARSIEDKNIAILERSGAGKRYVGVFSLSSAAADVELELPDGRYRNLIDQAELELRDGKLHCTGQAVILELEA